MINCVMPATIGEVTYEALTLSESERARLSQTLLHSLNPTEDAARPGADAFVDAGMLARRKELIGKFVSGEWGVEYAGYEDAQEADCASAKEQAKAWRD